MYLIKNVFYVLFRQVRCEKNSPQVVIRIELSWSKAAHLIMKDGPLKIYL